MTETTSVQVERDGVRLGWNVLAIMASLGLGLYVTSIIAPLKQTQITIQKDLVQLHKTFQNHADHILDDHANYGYAIKEQEKDIENLEEDVAELKSDIKSLQGNSK